MTEVRETLYVGSESGHSGKALWSRKQQLSLSCGELESRNEKTTKRSVSDIEAGIDFLPPARDEVTTELPANPQTKPTISLCPEASEKPHRRASTSYIHRIWPRSPHSWLRS